ncbi:sarcosine oxidase subunit gamma [Oceanospirillum sp.]|uniref:sarcosine oxidase subunit gamma n=1 Tax=Oceanospirillum sp. TaxID=2021254 RepID=UPI003A91252B
MMQTQDRSPEAGAVRTPYYRLLSGQYDTETALGGRLLTQLDAGDTDRLKRAGIVDLTLLPRVGYRGLGAEAFLRDQSTLLPETPNQSTVQPLGELALRLSPTEFWLLGSLQDLGQRVAQMPLQHRDTPAHCYPLFCEDSHAWFALTGDYIEQVMAKLCAVDLREKAFPVGAIAQTSVARTNCIVVRHQIRELPCFSILSDISSSEYLLTVLQDAVAEYQGGLCGIAPLL